MYDVAFVYTPCCSIEDDRLEPPLGLIYLATILDQMGVSCIVCDLSGTANTEVPEAATYGFSTYTPSYNATLLIKQNILQKYGPKFTFAGGPHATALPEEVLRDFDVVVVGEGEVAVQQLFQENIRSGIIYKPPVDINSIPFPNYSLVDISSYSRRLFGCSALSVISSRGCPHLCAFCNSNVSKGETVRFRSSENISAEIQLLIEKYGVRSFKFNDDTFLMSRARAKLLTRALSTLDIKYRVMTRVDLFNDSIADMLYGSGCRYISFGIESMSQKMLDVMQKGTTVTQNVNAIRSAKRAGLYVRIFVLVGFPGETEQTISETIDRLSDLEYDEVGIYPFVPYPGTDVWNSPTKYNARIDTTYSRYFSIGKDKSAGYVLTTDQFTPAKVEEWHKKTIVALTKHHTWSLK